MIGFRWLVLAVCLLGVISTSPIHGQQWTRFRGPNGSGLSRATTVPVRWTEKDFNYRVKLPGKGHASPVLWGKKVFLVSASEQTGQRTAVCLDADNGRKLWSRVYDTTKRRSHRLNSLASSTPTVDADRLYICWATTECVAQAFDHAGRPLWRTSLGPFKASYGFAVSPILVDDLLIIANEQQGESALIALDCSSGRIRWRAVRQTKASYSTPCLYKRAGHAPELIFTNWEHGITAVDPKTGTTNWEISVFDQKHVEASISSPIVAGDRIFGTCGWLGYGIQTVAVRAVDSPAGSARELFRVDRGAPLTTTPVVKDDLLFLWADNGIVTCTDSTNGKLYWRKRVGGNYYASPVIVADAVYCLSTDGEAVVLEAAKQYKLIARNPLLEPSHSSPAVADGTMYLRTFSHFISLGGRH